MDKFYIDVIGSSIALFFTVLTFGYIIYLKARDKPIKCRLGIHKHINTDGRGHAGRWECERCGKLHSKAIIWPKPPARPINIYPEMPTEKPGGEAPPPPIFVTLPKELTAENGAKALLSGEFYEQISFTCACGEDPDCEVCDGTGSYIQKIVISWINIKDIYKKIVKDMAI